MTGDRDGAVVYDLVDVRRARLEPMHRRVMREHLRLALRIDVRARVGRNRASKTALRRAETKPRPRDGFGRRPRGCHLTGGIRAELQVKLRWRRGSRNTGPPPQGGGARARREHDPAEADSPQDVPARGVPGGALHVALAAPT